MTRLTLFRATLVQDSALSISGVDRESTADRPFTLLDGVPVLSGRGLKGAAVAMARRFFAEPLPRSISEDPERKAAFQRSAWEFANATATDSVQLRLRAGVGVLQKTGARASGVLYDLETVPAGTRWPLVFRVDWSWAQDEGEKDEGILGYVLERHWKEGRCWLGGDVARGLGWCHIEDLQAWRLDEQDYEAWVTLGRQTLPQPLKEIPYADPTRGWHFRTRQLRIQFGEYRPNGDTEAPWGLDMLAVGPHSADSGVQSRGSGLWARPCWEDSGVSEMNFVTDRSVAMAGNRPLLAGASVRGPMRHAFSRSIRARNGSVQDPHPVQGEVGPNDPGGKVFGSVDRSSQVLISDAIAEDGWAAGRLHMHAEDEFSAGSFESAKRDAVRLLRADFPVRILVEGATVDEVETLTAEIDRLIALGRLGHLPIGGHKTRGAGWGRWVAAEDWKKCDVAFPKMASQPASAQGTATMEKPHERHARVVDRDVPASPAHETVWVFVEHGKLDTVSLTLEAALSEAMGTASDRSGKFVAWWGEPTIDLTVAEPPEVFGWSAQKADPLRIDEVIVFFERGSWRAARTAEGVQWVFIREVPSAEPGAERVEARLIPARLHGDTTRFAGNRDATDPVLVREWRGGTELIGFTLKRGESQ